MKRKEKIELFENYLKDSIGDVVSEYNIHEIANIAADVFLDDSNA